MKINIYQIAKSTHDDFEPLVKEFIKMSSKYAKVEVHNLFNKHISKAQTISENDAQKSYSEVFEPHLNSGYNIALDVLGSKVDSFKFAKFFENHSTINFFIGGAYGFEREFLNKVDFAILRDDFSASKAQKISSNENIVSSLDSSLLLPVVCSDEMREVENDGGDAELLGLMFVRSQSQEAFFKEE